MTYVFFFKKKKKKKKNLKEDDRILPEFDRSKNEGGKHDSRLRHAQQSSSLLENEK